MSIHSLSPLPLLPPHPKLITSVNINSVTIRRTHNNNNRNRNRTVTATTMSVDTYAVGEDLPVDYADWLPETDVHDRRRAGVLLHPTSFTGPYGVGDIGDQAFEFVDWLHHAGCSVWQVLPLVPPGRNADEEGSPYSGQDANCGNTLLISLDDLVKDGLLMKEELPEPVICAGT